jgi:protein O-mannosyl-transferase
MSVEHAPARSAPPRWLIPLVLGLTVLAFLPTLGGGFVADDFVYIARFREFPWSAWPRLFTHEWSEGIWGQALRELRPIAALSFMSDARFFGGEALGYRLTNLGLHLVGTFLLLHLAWYYTRGKTVPTILAALVFAVHPAHVEAVVWVTGRVDLLATTAALLFWATGEYFSAYGRRRYIAAAPVALFLGIFSKELCMFAPLLLLLRWLLLDPAAGWTIWRRRIAVLVAGLVIVGIYAACRRAAFGPENLGYNVWTDAPAWHRQASYASWLFPVLPFTGLTEWRSSPSITMLHGLWIALAVLVIAGLVVSLRRRAADTAAAWFFGGFWYFATVAPLTAVVYMSPRHLYFPSIGLAFAVGFLALRSRIMSVLGAAFVLWCAAGHVAAIQPWRTSANLSRVALRALDEQLAAVPEAALLVTSAPATLGPVLFWVWSSPQCFGAPFLQHLPAQVIEQPVMISRPVDWLQGRKPLETVRAAPAVVALHIDAQGRIACRRIPASEMPAHVETLSARIGRGIDPDSWDAWVKSLAAP